MKNIFCLLFCLTTLNTGCVSVAAEPSRQLASEAPGIVLPDSIECSVRQMLIGTDADGNRLEPAVDPIIFTLPKQTTDAASFYIGKASLEDGSSLQAEIEVVKKGQKTALLVWSRGSNIVSAASATTQNEKVVAASAWIYEPTMASIATKLNTQSPGRFVPGAMYAIDGKSLGISAKPVLANLLQNFAPLTDPNFV